MTHSIHDELRKRERPVGADDVTELRRIMIDLSTVLSGVVRIMEHDARNGGAAPEHQEILAELLALSNDIGERLEPESAGGT